MSAAPPSPLASLPADLLKCIFAFVPVPPRLRCISLVCKRWRAAALWSVSLLNLPAMQLDALRILPAVRELCAGTADIPEPAALRDLTQLACTFNCSEHSRLLDELVGASASTLTSLDITFHATSSTASAPHGWSALRLPSLTALTVCIIPWVGKRMPQALDEGWELFISRHCTQLAHLSVRSWGDSSHSMPRLWPIISQFPYPRLRTLELHDPAAAPHLSALLAQLPPTARLIHDILRVVEGNEAEPLLASRTTALAESVATNQLPRIALYTQLTSLRYECHAGLLPIAMQHSVISAVTKLSLVQAKLLEVLPRLALACPRLQSLGMVNAQAHPIPLSPLAPLTALTSLSYSSVEPQSLPDVQCLMHALASLPSLRYLAVSLQPHAETEAFSSAFFARLAQCASLEAVSVAHLSKAAKERLTAEMPSFALWRLWGEARMARYV